MTKAAPIVEVPSILGALRNGPLKVSVLGCGNWGTAIAKLAAKNVQKSYIFEKDVHMFVRPNTRCPENAKRDDATDLEMNCTAAYVNKFHVNPTFLPGIELPENLIATTSYKEIQESDLIIFVVPHQFVRSTCAELREIGGVKKDAKVLTLIKGIEISPSNGVGLISDIIKEELNVASCCALSGANVAMDIAREEWCETTIGYGPKEISIAEAWQQLLDTVNFKIDLLADVGGVQACGALKNLVAVAAGFSDGLGYGTNTKSALIRLGVQEIKKFCGIFFPATSEDVYFESAGFADVVTTCFGGRNVRCAAEFIRRGGNLGKTSWDAIEKEILGNQKMQGQLTCKETYEILSKNCLLDQFPLFTACWEVAFNGAEGEHIINVFRQEGMRKKISQQVAPVRPDLPESMQK